MIRIEEQPGFVVAELEALHEVCGWAIVGGGLRTASRVVFHGVRNEDLPPEVDAVGLLRSRMIEASLGDAVGMMTSRTPLVSHRADAERDGVVATAIVTAGMSNALRIGDRAGATVPAGTINVLCRVSVALTEAAMLEALSLVVEARTSAVIDHAITSVQSGAIASGTGTDCVTVAAAMPGDQGRHSYAGKHTAIGEVIGRATLEATREALARWKEDVGR
ncbi:MAG: adenosylcobinamide amidohydrolase [Polyangiaceae bacterium]|nr:adenosylcobinamide amidohydrolase [Polyangiaceae bacterium]